MDGPVPPRREGESFGLVVEIARHGEVPDETGDAARLAYVVVGGFKREVAYDDAPRLGLGALAPAQLPRPYHLHRRVRGVGPESSSLPRGGSLVREPSKRTRLFVAVWS